MMEKLATVGAVIAIVLLVTSAAAAPELQTVKKVDARKYMGRWHEIASIPAWFQKDCAYGTTADYTLRPDGDVEVRNQCYTAAGEVKAAKARAWVVDPKTNARLKVSFLPFGLKFFGGDYWIIDLGPDYEYAVVGEPSRQYGWILARATELSQETLDGIKQRLQAQGYDPAAFVITKQKPDGK